MGWFSPGPTQELTWGAAPPAVSLPMRSLKPPSTLVAGTLVGTDGGGVGEGAGEEPPPNSLPRIRAPAATAIGVARLPPGTAFLRESSNHAIASSLPRVDPITSLDYRREYRLAFSASIPQHWRSLSACSAANRARRPRRAQGGVRWALSAGLFWG